MLLFEWSKAVCYFLCFLCISFLCRSKGLNVHLKKKEERKEERNELNTISGTSTTHFKIVHFDSIFFLFIFLILIIFSVWTKRLCSFRALYLEGAQTSTHQKMKMVQNRDIGCVYFLCGGGGVDVRMWQRKCFQKMGNIIFNIITEHNEIGEIKQLNCNVSAF